MRLRLTALITLIAATALLAAACGGPLSKAEYEKQVEKIGKKAEKQLDKVIGGTSDKPPTESDLKEAQKVFEDTADELEGLNPPKEVAKPHDQLVKGMRELGETFGKLAKDVGKAKTDEERANVFLKSATDKEAQKAFEDLTKAQEAFAKKGYTVFDEEK